MTSHENNGDNRETINPHNNADVDVDDDADNNDPEIEIPGIPSIPSITASTSETEEERRRILEGIFAEDDDDEDDDEEEEDAMLSFLSHQKQQQQQQVDDGAPDGHNSAARGASSIDEQINSDDDIDESLPEEYPTQSQSSSSATIIPEHEQLLPNQAAAAARKARACESAFSSSSDEDEEFDEEQEIQPDNNNNKAAAEPVVTPRLSNTTTNIINNQPQHQQQQKQHFEFNEEDNNTTTTNNNKQPEDMMEATNNNQFSWIHSADEGEVGVGGVVDQHPSLSFNFTEDTMSTNKTTAADAAAAAAAAAADLKNNAQKQQHHQSQQSAFDRALNEVQAQGGRSRSNSFAFADATVVSSPKAGGDGGTTQQQQSETGGGHHVKNVNDEESSQSSGEGSSNNGDDSSGDSETAEEDAADEDDFFAKAEHTVLDEIMDAATDPSILAADAPSTASSNPRKQSGSSSTTTTTNSGDTRVKDRISLHTNKNSGSRSNTNAKSSSSSSSNNNPTAGLPDVLNSVRQKIESFNIFDADVSKSSATSGGHPPYPPSSNTIPHNGKQQQPTNMLMMDTVTGNNTTSTAPATLQKYYSSEEEREAMRRAFQQSISAAVLVSLAHKRYERRRLAAMEIEKVVRSLVVQEDYSRVRAILLLLSDDYVRSTNEDARKGGAVALAACAIGLKKANESRRDVIECRDLILASVVHACQDHSQRVRYYATESLFNVTKVIPSLAVQHFFILFEILRSLYADVDLDVRSGAELLDKKLKEVIVGAINAGSFSADACVPVFARFVYMRNKATKQLTLTWLKEFSEKLIGAPILEFLHLFLGGIFSMVADPNAAIRQLALEFLQSVLPKLLVNNEDFEDAQQNKVDFDKILQALVLTMEHPDPFVRKVAMYWMSRIVQAHMSSAFPTNELGAEDPSIGGGSDSMRGGANHSTAASTSVRSALAHILPGILLSIGDTHQSRAKDSFLPDQTAHSLAESANSCLQDAVRRDGSAFIPHLSGFIVALREELDSPGGLIARNPPSLERRPYRMDVKADGSGIESTGWFRASDGVEERDNALILSRLCALQWVVVLYEHVVPNSLKSEYAGEFIDCIIYQLVDQPPGIIIVKSFEVLAKISNPAEGEEAFSLLSWTSSQEKENAPVNDADVASRHNPMTDASANFALGVISESSQRQLLSRDRSVFASLIDLHSKHQKLLMDISKVIELMCTIQPPEFVFECFCLELDTFIISKMLRREKILESPEVDSQTIKHELASFAKDLAFVSNFAQQLSIVFFAAPETEQLRQVLKDSIGFKGNTVRDERRARLFHILLYTFSHNIVATLAFCLWGGAFLTASTFLQKIDPLDVSLMFYLEIDQLIDLIERPLFRHLHLRMLECEDNPHHEGSGAMLFRTLKSIMMLLPQSTSYVILKERLTSMARYRQSAVALRGLSKAIDPSSQTDVFVKRIVSVRQLHTDAKWRNIRAESLEEPSRLVSKDQKLTAAQQRREWLGYADEEEELATKEKIKQNLLGNTPKTAERVGEYEGLRDIETSKLAEYKKGGEECKPCLTSPTTQGLIRRFEQMGTGDEEKEDQSNPQWREYWASRQ